MPKRNKKPYSDLTLLECVERARCGDVDESDIVSTKSVLELKKLLQGLFTFLKLKREITKSPTDDMLVKLNSNTRRGVFTTEQVQSMIDHCLSQSEYYKKWAVIVMAYTGMRNSEVMQLRKQDIIQDAKTGIHYFYITSAAGSVKTKAAIRRVPIHSKLIQYGLLDFIAQSQDSLFEPNGRGLTSYYQRIKEAINLPQLDMHEDRLTLYSIRHRVITDLQSRGVNLATTQQLVGHSKKGSITDRYTHDVELVALSNAIESLNYQDL